MFIKRVEAFGFKSFRDRTVLEFQDQDITGVVGPNGCGKSNIVDALLWVMGENSPKNLRGEALSDIIFGGTSKEPAGNIAEVKLTLNPGKTGFPVGYENFSEIMISRRSYREGKSECFINDKECLLRDVREFFMNTGAGCRGFSIIEQESIEKLITAKPLQRRFIIEEAAGITKFKNQKAESLRKLQLVDQNLKRLDDILKMQTAQLSHLSSQAKKAEKYKKLKKEIEIRDKEIHAFLYQNLSEDQKKIQQERESKREQKKTDKKSLSEKKEDISQWNQELAGLEIKKEELKAQLSEKKIEGASLKDKAKTFSMIEEIKKKAYQLQLEREEIRKKLLLIKESFKTDYSLNDIQTEILKVKTKLDEIRQNKNSLQVHIDLLTKQMEFIKKEKSSFFQEDESLSQSIKLSINKKNQLKEEIKKQKNQQKLADKNFQELEGKSEELKLLKENLEVEKSQSKAEVSGLSHKVKELDKLLVQLSQTNPSSQELIQWKPEQFHLLFEKLDVDLEYTKALSVVLGSLQKAVVPDEWIDLEHGIEKLKETQKGKSWFLSRLPQEKVSFTTRDKLRDYPSFLCFLDEKVRWNEFNLALKPLLQKTAVVSDLKSAFELKKQFPSFQFVTKTADFITEHSMIYAGSDNQESSLLEIRKQVEESKKQLVLQTTQMKAKDIEWESCWKQFQEVQRNKKDQEKKFSLLIDSVKSSEKEIEFLEKDLIRLSETRDKNKKKIKEFEQKQENLSEHTTVFSQDIGKQDQLIASKVSYLGLLNLALEKFRSEKTLKKEEELLFNVIRQSDSSKETLSSVELKKDMEENQKRTQDLELALGQQIKDQEEVSCQEEQAENDKQALEQALFQVEMDLQNLKSEEEKKEIEKTHLKEKFQESYQMSIENFETETDRPIETLKEEMTRFQEQLGRIKEVNFLALDEYQKLSEDHEFLNSQKENLTASQEGITKVIYRIDKTCKLRFNEMLEETNKRFSKVFPIIFGGDNAKAELILHEEKGEQGVDIKVHPPGKKPQSISLLSRGEKSLTSLCLIYSLFLVRPSPFCIIDEADAPLDDANIFRFLSVLKEMSRKSQIIVITHNKYTMRNCNKLYGVTQKEPGVSQIVSVDMESSLLKRL